MYEVAPGFCRWMEYIYPTDKATIVFYRGRELESRDGGQQGCPLMMACHAVVQRVLLESLGIIPVDPRTSRLAPILNPPAQLDISPMYADDGLFAGRASEVARNLDHLIPIMPSLGLRFSMLEAIPAAGPNHQIALQLFRNMACACNETGNFDILKSPIGSSS